MAKKGHVAGYYPDEEWWVKVNSVKWPTTLVRGDTVYRISKAIRRWRRYNRYNTPREPIGVYVATSLPSYSFKRYIEVAYSKALPEYLQVSEGL